MGKIRSKHPIIVEEAADVYVVAGVAVACLAWPRKAELLARLGDAGREAGELAAAEALRSVLLGFRQQLEQHDGPRILLTHAMVRGSRTTAGQPLVGCDLELGVDDLALAGADLVALGHIHAHQSWDEEGIVYPGSPRRTEFGDTDAKGYMVVEFSDGDPFRDYDWHFIETPATPMLLLQASWDTESGALIGTHRLTDLAGAEIRFRYTVPAEHRDAARARAEEYRATALARGAIVVKLEEQVSTSLRARAPEVAEAKTLTQKLRAYWAAKGDDLGEREPVLLAKAGVLEVGT
jgi:exonuclease SbcD